MEVAGIKKEYEAPITEGSLVPKRECKRVFTPVTNSKVCITFALSFCINFVKYSKKFKKTQINVKWEILSNLNMEEWKKILHHCLPSEEQGELGLRQLSQEREHNVGIPTI